MMLGDDLKWKDTLAEQDNRPLNDDLFMLYPHNFA